MRMGWDERKKMMRQTRLVDWTWNWNWEWDWEWEWGWGWGWDCEWIWETERRPATDSWDWG